MATMRPVTFMRPMRSVTDHALLLGMTRVYALRIIVIIRRRNWLAHRI